MRFLILCLLVAIPLSAQTQAPSTRQETPGPCSVAIRGNNNQVFTCQGMTKEQGAEFLKILNRISRNQLDPKAVMDKLDECLKAIPQSRHLTEQQKATLRAVTTSFPPAWIAVGHVNNPEAKEYADEFKQVLGAKAANTEVTLIDTFSGTQVVASYNDSNRTFYEYASHLAVAMEQGGFPEVEFKPIHINAAVVMPFPAAVSINIGFSPPTR
jgi:hypothetical protein